jgi:hypothetical protein
MILETLNTLQKIGGVTKRDKNRTEQKKKRGSDRLQGIQLFYCHPPLLSDVYFIKIVSL